LLTINFRDFFEDKTKKRDNLLFFFALLSFILCAGYSFLTMTTGIVIQYVHDNSDMATAYNVLPSVMVFAWKWAEKSTIPRFLLLVISLVYIIALGTRGALLWLIVAIVLLFILYSNGNRNKTWILTVAILSLVLIVFGNVLMDYIEILLSKSGFSTRIFEKIQEANFFSSTSRLDVWKPIIDAIREHLWFGNGIYADRRIIGVYTHNIVLELILDYGVIFGSILFIALIFIIIKGFLSCNTKGEKSIILILSLSTIGTLMMSGSYLNDPLLFVLIGISVGSIRNGRLQVRKIHKELIV
jgi:O-antigen ligase